MRFLPVSFRTRLPAGLAAAVFMTSVTASASTVAHYRFENGSDGAVAAQAVDSSPNAHHLDAVEEPVYSADVPVSPLPQTGESSALAIDLNVENPSGNTQNAFEGAAGDALSQIAFTDFTIEAWVRYDNPANPQTIVGRDGAAPGLSGSNHSLLYFQSNNTGFRIEVVNSNNDVMSANSTVTPEAGVWYHVAAVGDTAAGEDGTLSIYVDGELVGSTTGFPGLAVPDSDDPWTIGRGMWNNNPGDWVNGQIDEVRISDSALTPNQFLNFNPDEFVFTEQPHDATLWAGQDVTFSADFVAGENLDISLQWEVSEDGGATWSAIGGATGSSYSITSATADLDRNRYRLVATDSNEGTTFTSDEAVLRVGDGEPAAPEGVVAHYRFEDGADGQEATTAVDSSGNGHDLETFFNTGATGTPTYSPDVPVALLPANGASNDLGMYFNDGNGEFGFRTPASSSLSQMEFTDFTFEAWVIQEAVGNPRTIIGRDDSPGEDGPQSGDENALIYFQSGWDGNFRIRVVQTDGSVADAWSPFIPDANQWYHVAAVGDIEEGTLSLYVDGELQVSVDNYIGLMVPDPVTPFTFGYSQWDGNPGDWMNGSLDEIRITNTALTPVEFLNFNAAVLAFVTHPQDVTAAAQDEVTFTSLAGGGSGELSYQWQVSTDEGANWTDIEGATERTYTIASATLDQSGNRYRVVATRGDATEISDVAILDVPDFPDPEVTRNLEPGVLVLEGETFAYSVEATGLGNISYQWQIDGEDLAGETGSTLVFDPATTEVDESVVSVVISDDAAMEEGLEPTSVTLSTLFSVAPRLKQAIGLNFVGTGSGEWGSSADLGVLAPEDVAGAVPASHWNNSADVTGIATQDTPIDLVDDTGASTTASATWSANNTWSARSVAGPAAQKDPDERLFHGYIEARDADTDPATVIIEGIPYASYDVYVYPMGVEGDAGTYGRSVTMEDENGTRQYFMRNLLGNPTPEEIPFILSHATDVDEAMDGHMATYFRFAGASGSTVTLQHFDEVDWNSGGFAAVAIVDTTPSTPARPGFVQRPADRFVPGGGEAVFSVSAESYNAGGSLSYQWRKDGVDLSGETGTTLTLQDVSSADSGRYSVVVTEDSDLGQSINIASASLVVVDEARPALLNVDMNVAGEPMSGNGMLLPDGVQEFVYPADNGDNPMNIGEGDAVWNGLVAAAGTTTYGGLLDSEGFGLPGVTFTVAGAAGAEDDTFGGGLEDVGADPNYSAPLFRDYVFTEGEDEMTLTVGGLTAFAGREVTLVVYAVGKDSTEWEDADNQVPDQNDVATVTLAEANNEFDEAPVATDQAEGREMRWNELSFAVFNARVAANGTVSWTVGPVAGEPGLNAFDGFQLLVTNQGEAIEPEGIADWRETHFGTSSNEGDAANDADPDGDGFKNLVEYALGTDPNAAGDAQSAVVRGQEGDFLTLTFDYIADSNLNYSIEATNDLNGTWTEVQNYGSFATSGTQTFTDDQSIGANPNRFLRLKVTVTE